MNKIVIDGYIVAVSTANSGEQIGSAEYQRITDMLQTAPAAPEGYAHKLRADNLKWELVEAHNSVDEWSEIDTDTIEETATETDYKNALRMVGVDV